MRRDVFPLVLPCVWALALGSCAPDARGPPFAATCGSARVALNGACVEPAVADRYCGKFSTFVAGACVPKPCPDGQVLDLGTGACLGARALRELGARVHVVFEEGQTLGCHEGALLQVANGHPWCRELGPPEPLAAGPGPCGAGEARDGLLGRCVRLVRDGAVDVAAWTRAVLGANGGLATPELCGRISQDPSALGLPSGGEAATILTAALVFPNNDVTQVHARTSAQDEGGRALPATSRALVDEAIAARVDALRALGGVASAASVEVRVRCVVRAGFQPVAIDPPASRSNVKTHM